MKKRKTPVLLLSMLVVLIGGAVVFGMSQNAPANGHDAADVKTDPHEAPSTEELGKTMENSTTPPKASKAEMMLPPEVRNAPSIKVDANRARYPKPTPDVGGSTSSQWYGKR
jgi:hypothetical protein